MDRLWDWLRGLARAAILAGCALLFIAALIVTAEVLVRKAVPDLIELVTWLAGHVSLDITAGAQRLRFWVRDNLTFSGSDEISGYLFAVGTSWSMAHVLITRGHVRIDALYGGLGPRLRAWLDLVALVLLAVFVGALVERAFDVATTNFIEYNRSNTNLRVPLAWAQLPWLAGIVLFFLVIVVTILKVIGSLLRGQPGEVARIAGAASMDEEIESELKGLGIETAHGRKT